METITPDNKLSALQQWVYRCITHPAGVEQGALEAASSLQLNAGSIEHIVKPSATLTATDRLAIYHNAYHLRLMGVLEAEYPALKKALGDELFNNFALFYLQQNPPHSYTLYQLSAQLPEFLAATVPQEDAGKDWPNFIIDLAKLERMFQEVYRGPGMEGKPKMALADVERFFPQAWDTHTVVASPCLQLMSSQYPIHQYLMAARQQGDADLPAPLPSWIAVCRVNYHVKIHGLTENEFDKLLLLLQGNSFHAAGIPDPACLEKWMEHGFFEEVAQVFG